MTSLLNEKTETLLKYIEEAPGVRYRELLRMTGLTNGVLSYHLDALEISRTVMVDRSNRSTRYFPTSVSKEESNILKHLRHEPTRQIVAFVLENEMCTFRQIVGHTGKAPSTISANLKKLEEDGVLTTRTIECKLFKVIDKEMVLRLLSKYNPTLAD